MACQQLKLETANSLRGGIAKALKRFLRLSSNLSIEERKALQNLKSNKDLTIIRADEGRAMVLMNTKDYKSKILDLVKDQDTYEPLKRDYTNY